MQIPGSLVDVIDLDLLGLSATSTVDPLHDLLFLVYDGDEVVVEVELGVLVQVDDEYLVDGLSSPNSFGSLKLDVGTQFDVLFEQVLINQVNDVDESTLP